MKIRKKYQGTIPENKVVDSYTKSDSDVYNCNYINSSFGGKILWKNNNPSSNFSEQNIILNSSNYDYYQILYVKTNTIKTQFNSGNIIKGNGTQLTFFIGQEQGSILALCFRDIEYVNETTLKVKGGYWHQTNSSTLNSGNQLAIPLYVIGYKTNLFK